MTKIHEQNNPGRPILPGIGTVKEKLSFYVDSLISKMPSKFPSFVKDTNDFLSDIMELRVPPDSLLVTLDGASMYTNIAHDDGVRAVIETYDESSPIDSETLATLLKQILQLKNFEFDDSHYIKGQLHSKFWPLENLIFV